MFMTKEMANIAFLLYALFIALPFGGIIGWSTGKLINRLLRQTKRTIVLDVILGFGGFLVGTLISFIGYSLEEEFLNGELIYRKVTGFADYYYLLAAIGAVLMVVMVHLGLLFINRICRNQNRAMEDSWR
jgi:hypothetical protein